MSINFVNLQACRMIRFKDLFQKTSGVVIAMCHVQALPGCPKSSLRLSKIADEVLKEAEIYLNAGVNGIMIENMHDVPYAKEIGPEIVAGMTNVATRLRNTFPDTPIGIQILTAANKEAVAVAKCAELNFVRCEGFVFSHIGDEGWVESCAGSLLRYRKAIDAENILIFSDVKKKHSSHHVTSDVSINETARAAEFFLSDGIIVTGSATGIPAEHCDLLEVTDAVQLPVLIGSGITRDNIEHYGKASGYIVGSHFKHGGLWSNPVNPHQVKAFMNKALML